MGAYNTISYFALKDSKACSRLVHHLVTKPSDSIIVPFADYTLTKEILSKNPKSLSIYESDDKTREDLKTLIAGHDLPNIDTYFRIHPDDLLASSLSLYDDEALSLSSRIVSSSRLAGRRKIQLDHNQKVKILMPLMKKKFEDAFLRAMFYQVALRIGSCSDILVDYYTLLSDRIFKCINAQPGQNLNYYRAPTVLFKTFFNVHLLETYNLKSNFRINLQRLQTTAKRNRSLYENAHSVWWEPKHELIQQMGPSSMVEYKFFVYQLMCKRTGLIVPAIENWFRGCRRDLAKLGITAKTRVGDVGIEQYLQVFEYLKGRPDYRKSTLRQAVASSENTSMTEVTGELSEDDDDRT